MNVVSKALHQITELMKLAELILDAGKHDLTGGSQCMTAIGLNEGRSAIEGPKALEKAIAVLPVDAVFFDAAFLEALGLLSLPFTSSAVEVFAAALESEASAFA